MDSKIKIVGLGESGARAISKMIAAGLDNSADFIAIGKDENLMLESTAQKNIFLNREPTTIYRNISNTLRGAKIIFIVGGLGGNSAKSAVPIIISCAKNLNAATVAFINPPSVLENPARKKISEYTLANLGGRIDTTFFIPVEKLFLFRINQKEVSLSEVFDVANEIFCMGVKMFLDMLAEENSLCRWGNAAFGYGYGNTALEAIKNAAHFPTFDIKELQAAQGIFIRLTGGSDSRAKNFITDIIRPDAKLFWRVDNSRGEKIFASIIFNL